jgi:peptide/nickel transport system permease protein
LRRGKGGTATQRYILTRLGHVVVVVFLSLTAVFFILRMTGNPAALFVPMNVSKTSLSQFAHEFGFDRPLWQQYLSFLWQALHGNFGQSLAYRASAMGLVLGHLPATASLALLSLALSLAISVPLGVWAAMRPDGWLDNLVSLLVIALQSMPIFWLGLLLILVFAVDLRLVPPSGREGFSSYILPVVTLSTYTMAAFLRLTRASMAEALGQDYVRTARAKGATPARVLVVHALRNSLIPLVTVVGLNLATLLGGAVVTETIFSWPGLGRLLLNALLNRDFTIVQAGVFFISAVYSVTNLAVDILYAAIDPRIHYT